MATIGKASGSQSTRNRLPSPSGPNAGNSKEAVAAVNPADSGNRHSTPPICGQLTYGSKNLHLMVAADCPDQKTGGVGVFGSCGRFGVWRNVAKVSVR